VTYMNKGKYEEIEDIIIENDKTIKCLKQNDSYKYLGILENITINTQETIKIIGRKYLQRTWVIWNSD